MDYKNCNDCLLHQTRNKIVWGDGNIDGDVMFIGEGPGADENEQGIPFIGRSGQLLRKCMTDAKIDIPNVFITNMVMCRPPENRRPAEDEIIACSKYLKYKIETMRPKLIVCVGRVASKALINKNFRISMQHGHFFKREEPYHLVSVFHPSYILRNRNLEIQLYNDLCIIREWCVEKGFKI